MAVPQPVVALAIVALQVTTTSLAVGFVARDSLLRLGGLAVTLLAAHSQLSEARIQHPVARPLVAAASVFLALMYIDTVLLSRWTFAAEGPTSSLGGLDPALGGRDKDKEKDSTEGSETAEQTRSSSAVARLRFGFNTALQSRFPCTPWAVKHTQGFDPSETPPRPSFIRDVGLRMFFNILLLRAGRPSRIPSQDCVLFSPYRIPMVGNIIYPAADWWSLIDWEELEIRQLGVSGYWLTQYQVITLLDDLCIMSAVALRITEVEMWPPLFGEVSEAWSLRRFWGEFQPQIIRRSSSSVAHFVTHAILHLPKGGRVARYVFMSVVFTISAGVFLLVDTAMGVPVRESGAVVFFCGQIPAIMLEDLTLAVAERMAVSRGFGVTAQGAFSVDRLPPNAKLIIRAAGYLWVLTWLTWMSPVWIFPAMERDTEEPIIPF